MDQLTIRSAPLEDFDAVSRLLGQLNDRDPLLTPVQGLDTLRQIIATAGLDLLVADSSENVAGSCYLNIVPNLTAMVRPYAVIENVVTDKYYRGQGIGQRMVAEGVDRAADAKCYKVMLMSGRKDQAVYRFYRGCGFDQDEKQAFVRRLN